LIRRSAREAKPECLRSRARIPETKKPGSQVA
jgi:hypothetical protein